MNTIHHRLHSVNDRRSHQTARAGWRPRQTSPRQLAADIANSIRQHRAAGDACWVQPHEFTPNPDIQAMVQALLNPTQPEKESTCL
ncbi:MAG: hypothetical protein ETSY1_37470 [Candidatus Entotheonella factor]|uniref:Uncharacterized protein n=1 Tax=Entotheonella factor TaxID=1429438 RepID=W4L943_ENTF1|nr:MAG: hypothetical protein ETSY1_37470 [Candidatus Entotheonella factor]